MNNLSGKQCYHIYVLIFYVDAIQNILKFMI